MVVFLLLAAAGTLSAQNNQLSREGAFTAGASFGDGKTAAAFTAGLGFRFTHRIGILAELAHARKLDFTIDLCPPPRLCVIGGQFPVTGRTLALVPHVTFDLFPESSAMRGFVAAGIGMGHVRQRYVIGPSFFAADRVELTRSKLTAALSLGGGVMVDIGANRRLAVGADVRVQQLFDDEGEDARFITPAGTLATWRAGARAAWKF